MRQSGFIRSLCNSKSFSSFQPRALAGYGYDHDRLAKCQPGTLAADTIVGLVFNRSALRKTTDCWGSSRLCLKFLSDTWV